MIDPCTPISQQDFGDLVGITQQAVSALAARGILRDGDPLSAWLLAYCEHLRMIAAGRGGDGGLELASERAALARAQRDKIEMQNAVTRRELAPSRLVRDLLAGAAARVARILDTIPGVLKRRMPGATAEDIAVVSDIIAKARNAIAGIERKDIFAAVDDDEPVDMQDAA